jgi:acetoin utilization deacetylase AcuC-like enzyme
MILITSTDFEQHVTPPGHPERPERAHVFDAVATRWLRKGGRTMAPRAAVRGELERVHDAAYLDDVNATAGRAVMLDADTFTSPDTYAVALLAAGAAVQAAEHAMDHHEPVFALVRPPGHHAERARAMGFCLFNNVAVAAAAMLDRGVSRIAVVDIDVHHGNGTQSIFYDDPRVLYVSTHQHPFYPGSGACDEVGRGEGRGFTVNIPMEAGCDDADYALAFRAIVEPIVDAFAPELVLVSAGYDAHERDPLASMRVTTGGYGALVERLRDSAARHGELALVTEGGYELPALAACLEASFAVVDGVRASEPVEVRPDRGGAAASVRGERAVASARASLKPFWRGL